MKDVIIEKIFCTEKSLKDLLYFLRSNNGKRQKYIQKLIYDINDILDFISFIKKEEIYKEDFTQNPVLVDERELSTEELTAEETPINPHLLYEQLRSMQDFVGPIGSIGSAPTPEQAFEIHHNPSTNTYTYSRINYSNTPF